MTLVDYDMRGLGFRAGDLVVITGAGSGIGRATALLAARSGLCVVGWDMAENALGTVIEEIRATGGEGRGVVCDVREADDIDRAWEETAKFGVARYLVNNAGPPSSAELRVADGLVAGAGSMVAVTERWMSRTDEPEATTFTASVAGNFTAGGVSNWYPVTKAAIAAYARQVAVGRHGRPRANAVAPGLTATPRTEALMASDVGRAIVARNPLGRAGRAEEIAAAICFLLSPAASYINGVTLPVDGAGVWVS